MGRSLREANAEGTVRRRAYGAQHGGTVSAGVGFGGWSTLLAQAACVAHAVVPCVRLVMAQESGWADCQAVGAQLVG